MRFKKKPVIVDAVQFVGQNIEGMKVVRPKIYFSLDNTLFYVSGCNGSHWLSIEPDKNGFHTAYPFILNDIESTRSIPADENKGLVEIYLKTFDLTLNPIVGFTGPVDYVTKVNLGDWVVTYANGEQFPYSPELFKEEFEPVDDGQE